MPDVSVVVRSYNRLPALVELVAALLAQDHPSFEVVVVEQSTDRPADAEARLEALAADPRLRILRHPPLGGARARNLGAQAAKAPLLLFIDDDDTPIGTGWIAAHAACHDDPRCLGVTGRHLFGPDEHPEHPSPYPPWLAARHCMRFSPILRVPWTYARFDRPVAPVDYVHGTNGSIRAEALARFGGWDEDGRVEDESSFGYRALRLMAPGEHFRFDPRPIVRRGLDVAGGLGKRQVGASAHAERHLTFVHRVIARYFPWRVRLLYPFYLFWVWRLAVEWIWLEAHAYPTFWRRLGATVWLAFLMPWLGLRALGKTGLGRAADAAARGPGSLSPAGDSAITSDVA